MNEKEKITHKQIKEIVNDVHNLHSPLHYFINELNDYIDQQEKLQNRINELLSDCDLLEHKLSKREKLFALNNEYARNNMSKAEKMFNELGYVLDESGGVFKRYTKKIIIGEVEHIYRLVFNPIDCNYGISVQIDDKEYSPYINIRTHKAIHEQMKELRWLDE